MEKVCYLESWNEFSSQLKETIARAKLNPARTLIRLCPRKNLQRIIQNGTDRDKNSRVWNHPLDAEHKTKIDPAQIFYAWMLDITKEPIKRVYEIINPDPFAPIYAIDGKPHFIATQDILPGQISALYNSDQTKRLSVCEYMFLGNPLDALCCVFALAKDTCDIPELSYYFN